MVGAARAARDNFPKVQTVQSPIDVTLAEALTQARALLSRNLVAEGILAATPSERAEQRNYTRIFGRDAAICALGMAVSGESALIEGAQTGLRTLAAHQADNGQIPKYVDPAQSLADFWYVGCIDSTLWWLIAVHWLDRRAPDAGLATELQDRLRRAIIWLHCQEHPQLCLLQQNEASDWADIMPRSGFVLYTNALWYYVKCLYGLPRADVTKYHFNHLFYPFSREVPDYRRLRLLQHYVRQREEYSDLYLSFVNFSFWGGEGDVLGNLLAVLFGLAQGGPARRILRALRRAQIDRPCPVRAVVTPIERSAALWRPYMGRHRQNLAFQYHNGGAWPFIGGFWVLALARYDTAQCAADALLDVARVNSLDGWGFNEWFHGHTGIASGMVGQSWNAAMLLLAHHGLSERVF